jgi:GAF domain-containing protein
MNQSNKTQKLISNLQNKLALINHSWTLDDYESLLRFYVEILPNVMEADRCSIFFINFQAGNVWLKLGTHLEEKQIIAPIEGSYIGRSASTGLCVIANDLAEKNQGFHAQSDHNTGFVTESLICVPIKSQLDGTISGVIQMLNKNEGQNFTDKDEILLTKITNYLSMVIDNIIINKQILEATNKVKSELERIQRARRNYSETQPSAGHWSR